MRRFYYAAALLLTVAVRPAPAQPWPAVIDETFALASLDPSLAGDAVAVVRLNALHFEVAGPGKATKRVRYVVTIFDPRGRDYGEVHIPYDDRRDHLKKLRGRILDAEGRVVRTLKRDDQEDYSAISGYSLYEESRVRIARLYHDSYPYTVVFDYELRYEGLVGWPTWYPQRWDVPVETAGFELTAPARLSVRYEVQGVDLEPAVTQRDGRQIYRWLLRNLPRRALEPHGPPPEEQLAAVHTATDAFEIEGTRGDMRSWQAFGRWYAGLSEGRDVLPEAVLAEVRRRSEGATDDRTKAQRLYEYLQETTRYVSIQLGLGGWQPFEAGHVHRHGYGDCKALTNYMRALLKAAGIPAFPALIRSGGHAPEVLRDFPSNQFNHVVLYVPLEDAPVWLECTSQTAPFGHLTASNEDRYALLVRTEGGLLVRTPRSEAAANQQIRQAEIRLETSGNARVSVRTRYTGNQQDPVRQALVHRSDREREVWLHERLDIPSFELLEADFSDVEARKATVEVAFEANLPRFASPSGRRLFLPLTLLDRWSYVPPPVEPRTQPVQLFPYAFVDIDTVRYQLPEGYQVEAMPPPVKVETVFGRYTMETGVAADGTMTCARRLEITEPRLPAEEYETLRSFLIQVARADRSQVVVRR